MTQGYSQTMRHLERTHGVCLRSLAERFNDGTFELVYERSALQAGDIYTKGFTNGSDWARVLKLVNHLDPKLFWEGKADKKTSELPSEHKGGVVFDYWTSNPWFANVLGPPRMGARIRTVSS